MAANFRGIKFPAVRWGSGWSTHIAGCGLGFGVTYVMRDAGLTSLPGRDFFI